METSTPESTFRAETSHLDTIDTIVYDLHENLFAENEDFLSEWRKNNMHYQDGDSLVESIHKLRTYFHVAEENILDFLINTTDALNVHFNQGGTNVAEKLQGYKQRLELLLADIREREYESKNFVGRETDIVQIMNIMTEKNVSESYIGVCVCGVGGNGKTMVAKHICLKLKRRNWDCVEIDAREVKTLPQLLRGILGKFDHADIMTGNKEVLQETLMKDISTEERFRRETVLLIDNIDDLNQEWEELIRFLEKLMMTIHNNTDIKVKVLLTSRRKLVTDRGIYRAMANLFSKQQSRFDSLCMEIELKSLTYDSASTLVKSLLPQEIQDKISTEDIKKLLVSSGNNPLLIHTLCDTLRHGNRNIADILRNIQSILTPVTGRCDADSCINETFSQLADDHQATLVKLAVFKTRSFTIDDAVKVTGSFDQITLRIKLGHLKMYHLLETSCQEQNEFNFSLHPIVFHFLKSKADSEQFASVFRKVEEAFKQMILSKMEKFETIKQNNYTRLHNSFLKNEAHFHIFLEMLNKQPENGIRSVKQNKMISEIADLIISDEKKIEMMKKLKESAEKKKEHLVVIFWKIELAEAGIDMDEMNGLEKLNKVGSSLRKIGDSQNGYELIPVLAMLLFLKGKWYFKYDEFEEGYKTLYAALYIMKDMGLLFDSTVKLHLKQFRSLRSNLFNLAGCLLLRERGAEDDSALHCFVKAFALMLKTRTTVRSSNAALHISNISACFYYRGLEIKKDRPDEAKAIFKKAFKWSEKAISLRQRMGQEKFTIFAIDLQKRGKIYLESENPHDYILALQDFRSALQIHLSIEKFPHSNITLNFHLLGKAGILIGQDQIEKKKVKEPGEENLRFTKLFYDCIAQLIYDNGLEGYSKEYQEIKENHLWLLDKFNDTKKSRFVKMYQECESGERKNTWKKNSRRKTKLENQFNDLYQIISKEDIFSIMEVETQQKVDDLVTRVKELAEPLPVDELNDLLPLNLDIDDDKLNVFDSDEQYFDKIIQVSKTQEHKDSIAGTMAMLNRIGGVSKEFAFANECIKLCKKDVPKEKTTEQRIAKKRSRFRSQPDSFTYDSDN